MKKWQRIAICLTLSVCILTMSISVFATDPTPTPTNPSDEYWQQVEINNRMMSYFIWTLLRSWGIQVGYEEFWEWGNNDEVIIDTILDWVLDYLDTLPSTYTINQWIAPWQASYDYWGNLRGNESLLEDIQDFADWLIQELGLSNGNTEYLNPIYTVSGYNLYEFNKWYYDGSGTYFKIECDLATPLSAAPDYWFPIMTLYDGVPGMASFAVISNGTKIYSTTVRVRCEFENGGQGSVVNINFTSNDNSALNSKGYKVQRRDGIGPWYPSNGNYFFVDNTNGYDWASVNQFMDNAEIAFEADLPIIVSTILLPNNDPAYTEGDSIVIIDGEPDYQVIEWSGEVTIQNLPAIVSTGTILTPGDELNPGLISVWRPISAVITYSKDAIESIIGIMYEFPEEVIMPVYAIMGGIIIFGVIKLMREH